MPGPGVTPDSKNNEQETSGTVVMPGGTGPTATTTGDASHVATGSGSGTDASLAAASGGGDTGSENIPADDPNAPKGTAAVEEAPKAPEGAAPVDAAAAAAPKASGGAAPADAVAAAPKASEGAAPADAAAAAAPKASGGAASADAAATAPKAPRGRALQVDADADDVQDDASAVPGAGNAADANSARRANPYGNVMPMRMQVLVQRLVVEHREAKISRDQALREDRRSIRHTKRVARNQNADDAAFYTGIPAILGAATAALGPKAGELLGDSETQKMAKRANSNDMKRENLTEGEKSYQDAFNWIGLAGNAFGALSGGIKTVSSLYRAKTDRNKHKRRTAGFRALSGLFSAGGSIAGGFSNAENLGLFGGWGMERGSDARKRGGIADIFAGIGGMGDKVFDYLGNLQEAHGYSSASSDIDRYSRAKSASADTRLEKARRKLKRKRDIPDNLSDDEKEARRLAVLEARRKRNTAKAQKYAMAQAKSFNDARSKSPFKGAIGAVGGLAGGLGSILTGIGKQGGGLSNELGSFGTIFSAIGGVAKVLGAGVDKVIDKSEENRLHQSKEEVITDYLDGKIERIKEEADQVSLSDLEKQAIRANKLSLTDNEARTIAIMRLGVAIPEDTSDLSALKHKSELFQKITEKRAKNILMSEPAEKKAMLTALGLDEDAALEDVVKALSAGWDPSVGLVDKATVPIKQKGKSLKNKISGFFRRH